MDHYQNLISSISDGGREIFVLDGMHPEDNAMVQAMYSRSPESVRKHLEKVSKVGSGKFMSQYYVNYGHASIGDCGTTTIFIENCSMMVAKAIQDNGLYSGQEASTRYLDFAVQSLYDPYDHPASRAILDGFMRLYMLMMPLVTAGIKLQFPYNSEMDGSRERWENTAKVRAFDILRSVLPVGTTTLFSWSTNLRQARDRFMQLTGHPLEEVRDAAQQMLQLLKGKYTFSFTGEEMTTNGRYADRHAYTAAQGLRDNFLSVEDIRNGWLNEEEWLQAANGMLVAQRNLLDLTRLNKLEAQALMTRPQGCALNRRLAVYGLYNLFCAIDFGSFRDLQRHRNGICQVPLIENWGGMHPWYMDSVREVVSAEEYSYFENEIGRLLQAIDELPSRGVETDKLRNQYLFPMGIKVMAQLAYSVPQTVYVAELRSQTTVHQTLRPLAQQMGDVLLQDLPGIALNIDRASDNWTLKRGGQTITAKAG